MEHKPIPAWQIWRNPILIRYMRARLRWKALFMNGVPTLILTAFVFFFTYFIVADDQRVYRGRSAFIAVFVVQCLIIMLRGTFSVAAGVTREGLEGLLEYQRLTPMSPLAKIIGYVLGLPILETVLVGMTLPFTYMAVQIGEIPWPIVAKLYLVMASSTLLYHMTGFLAGIVIKNRVMAGLLSQLLMMGLYIFLPQLSRFGYVLFEYLTVWPVFTEVVQAIIPEAGRARIPIRVAEPFFDGAIPLVWFTLLVQGFLFAVFLLVVYRRVRSEEEHLLGKFSAIPVLGGLVTILLGTVLPGIDNGSVFPSMSDLPFMFFGGRYRGRDEPFDAEMIAIPGVMGFALLIVVLLVVFAVTPSEDQRLKGLRLARKLGRSSVPWYRDAASSAPTTIICATIGIVVWMVLLARLLDSRWYVGWSLSGLSWVIFPLALLVPVLCFQLTLEVGGRAVWFFSALFAWLVPPMAGVILLMASRDASDVVIYLISISGLSLPINAMRVGFEEAVSTRAIGAYWFSLFLHLIALAVLALWAGRKRTDLRRRTLGAEELPAADADRGAASVETGGPGEPGIP